MKKIASIIFTVGLLYILLPGPQSVNDFTPIPDSLKSKEIGDTVQVPNIAAYFSQYDRQKITDFYKGNYREKFPFSFLIAPISLNYPPVYAKTYVRDQQVSTFLEEYAYPLKGSLFVNGYEPEVEDKIRNKKSSFLGNHIHINGNFYVSKITLRYYPAAWYISLLVYVSIWMLLVALFGIFKKVLKDV